MRVIPLLLIIPLLAGCADNGEPTEQTDEPTVDHQSSVAQNLNATTSDGNFTVAANADAFLLPGATGPETPLRSFHWRVPSGALVQHEFIEDWQYLYLEVNLLSDQDIDDWGLLVFETDGTAAQLVGSAIGTDLHTISKLAVLPTEDTQEATLGSFFLNIGPNAVQEGDRLTFVAYAHSADAGEFNVGFKVRQTAPNFDSVPGNVLQGDVAEMLVYGEGEGAQLAFYADVNILGAIGLEAWTDSVVVEDRLPVDLRPMATARDVTLSAEYPDRGWSAGAGIYLGYEAHGLWSAAIDAHGLSDAGQSIIAEDLAPPLVFLAEFLVFGIPLFGYEANGEGAASSSFDLLVTNANYIEVMLFQQLDLGATVQELTGIPSQDYSLIYTGLAGDIPPSTVERLGDDLIIGGQVPMTLPDFFAHVDA